MSDDDLSEQLAAHALDALDDDERDAVTRALDLRPDARAELDRYEHVAALLGEAADAQELPAGSWERLAAQLDRPDRRRVDDDEGHDVVPPLRFPPDGGRVSSLDEARSRLGERRGRAGAGRGGRRWLGGIAAAAAVAALVLGGVVVQQRDEIGDLRAQTASADQAAAAAALARPGSRVGTLASPDSLVQVRAVIDDRGTAYLFADALPALPDGRTYQLWTLDAAQPVSLGVLGARPGLVTVPASTALRRLAITAESTPGATAPTATPLVSGTLV